MTMKISDLLKLSTDNLRRRKGRTALTVIGVVVGTCAIVVMISLGIATNRRTDEMLSTWSDLTQIQVFSYSENPDTPALDDKMVAQFKEMENVVAATPLYNFQSMNANVVAGKKDRYSMYMYNAVGMDVDAIEPMGIELVSGSYLTGQSLGRNKIPVLVGEDTAYQFEDTKKSYRNPDRYRWKETDENGNVIKQPFFDITKETLTMQMIYEYDDQGNPKMREYELVVVGVMKTDYSKRGTEGIIMNIADMKRLEEEYKKLSKNSGMGGGSVVMYGGSSGTKVKGYDQVYVKVDDVNHVGAVEADSPGLFQNAALYIGEVENRYLTGEVRRKVLYHLYKLPQVTINNKKVLLQDGEVINIDGIKIECFFVPGHTWGHMVYLVDDRYLFTGDTIWFGADGGYSFISALAEDNELAVRSLTALEEKLRGRDLHPLFITGHTGWTDNMDFAFAHKNELCSPFRKKAHDPNAPYDAYDESDDTEERAKSRYLAGVGR